MSAALALPLEGGSRAARPFALQTRLPPSWAQSGSRAAIDADQGAARWLRLRTPLRTRIVRCG